MKSAALPSEPSAPKNAPTGLPAHLVAALHDIDLAAIGVQNALALGQLYLADAYLAELRRRVADLFRASA